MPVPSAITDLSTTAASNSPADTEQRTTADDYFRALSAFIRQLYDGTTGGQIVFPATQNASSNANTLDDYEEGTFTPIDVSGGGLTLTTPTGRYIKVGKLVHIQINVTYPATADTNNARLGNLPFTSSGTSAIAIGYTATTNLTSAAVPAAVTYVALYKDAAFATNANLSGSNIVLGGTYEATA